jgi:phosphoribosylamine--glycine ligase
VFDADVKVFHAGTRLDERGSAVTAGGRVLTVCALGAELAAARTKAYDAIGRIRFDGAFFRRDIAHRALRRN